MEDGRQSPRPGLVTQIESKKDAGIELQIDPEMGLEIDAESGSGRYGGFGRLGNGNQIDEHDEYEKLERLRQVHDLATSGSGESTEGQLYYSSPFLKEFKSPMDNTMLHLAALHGNDDMVDRVVQEYPDLLFFQNKNGDTPLHVAARAGCTSTLGKQLEACADYYNVTRLLELMKMKNEKGNIMLHEAIMGGPSMASWIFDALETCSAVVEANDDALETCSCYAIKPLSESCYELALSEQNNQEQSVLYLAVEARFMGTVRQILENCPERATPKGISPLLVAMMMRDEGMLINIVDKKKEWIHLADSKGMLPLHYAALIGYHEGVSHLLHECETCSIKRDNYGRLPIHVAAMEGHVEVVDKLLRYCPDVNEMLRNDLSNILHIAARFGKLDVVRYILQNPALKKMINQQNDSGDTPLHVAASRCHPKIVSALTWDHRVDIDVVNQKKQTPLGIVLDNYDQEQKPRPRQTLTWIALKSAGAKRGPLRRSPGTATNPNISGVSSTDRYKDRLDSLSTISTLVVTASVAACLTVPGEAEGKAHNLYKAMFHVFTFCITISLFTSISATIMLIWARLRMIKLLQFAVNWATRLIGAALITLSLAFLAGVYTVISELTWLATTFVFIAAIFISILFVQFMFLVLPSPSTRKFLRYISHYPFIFLASLAERKP